MKYEIIPAVYLPANWDWFVYEDGSGSLYSPEYLVVVQIDYCLSEYFYKGEWNRLSGYPMIKLSFYDFISEIEKIIASKLGG